MTMIIGIVPSNEGGKGWRGTRSDTGGRWRDKPTYDWSDVRQKRTRGNGFVRFSRIAHQPSNYFIGRTALAGTLEVGAPPSGMSDASSATV